MTTKAGAASEIAVLQKAARANGFKFVPAGGGHKKVVDHRGKPVVDKDGPLILSSSPSDFRWREMTVKRWLAAKVIKEDPFESQTKSKAVRRATGALTGRGAALADPDVQAAKVAAIHARSERLRQEAQELREKLEPIIVKIGGGEKHGMGMQIARVLHWFLAWRGTVERFPNDKAAEAVLRNLRSGNAINDRSRTAIGYFVDELLKAPDPAARYFELLRLSKGLPPKEGDGTIRGGTPLSDPPPLEEREAQAAEAEARIEAAAARAAGSNGKLGPATKPSLALEAVAYMVLGKEAVDLDRVLKIGEEIQEMELRERGLA